MWKDQFLALAKYNQNMNEKLYLAAAQLSEADLHKDQAAFFKSVWGTLHHIFSADLVWLRRYKKISGTEAALAALDGFPAVISFEPNMYADLLELRQARKYLDRAIHDFFTTFEEDRYDETLKYQNMAGQELENKLWVVFTHLFNHQTHHRGQATTLLSQMGLDVGVTDFPFVIREQL